MSKLELVFELEPIEITDSDTLSKLSIVSCLLDYLITSVSRSDSINDMHDAPRKWLSQLRSGWDQPTPSVLEARTQVYI